MWWTLSARTLGCFRAHLREQRGERFARLQGDALGGTGPAWVQLGPPLARGAPAGELTAASSTTGTSKRGLALYFKGARWAVPSPAASYTTSAAALPPARPAPAGPQLLWCAEQELTPPREGLY
jgi:hypothetical protein